MTVTHHLPFEIFFPLFKSQLSKLKLGGSNSQSEKSNNNQEEREKKTDRSEHFTNFDWSQPKRKKKFQVKKKKNKRRGKKFSQNLFFFFFLSLRVSAKNEKKNYVVKCLTIGRAIICARVHKWRRRLIVREATMY